MALPTPAGSRRQRARAGGAGAAGAAERGCAEGPGLSERRRPRPPRAAPRQHRPPPGLTLGTGTGSAPARQRPAFPPAREPGAALRRGRGAKGAVSWRRRSAPGQGGRCRGSRCPSEPLQCGPNPSGRLVPATAPP